MIKNTKLTQKQKTELAIAGAKCRSELRKLAFSEAARLLGIDVFSGDDTVDDFRIMLSPEGWKVFDCGQVSGDFMGNHIQFIAWAQNPGGAWELWQKMR